MPQNSSHAVMSQRIEAKDSADDFPTPPWATRALLEHILPRFGAVNNQTCLEPACGRGHMDKVLREYFSDTQASDFIDYGYGEVANFLEHDFAENEFDWVITNPPFRLAEDFIQKSLKIARQGAAMLVRTVFLESVGRYERLFSATPPKLVAQFTERVPMVKGRLDAKASTATGYAWIIWTQGDNTATELTWIPKCRRALEKDGDYEIPGSRIINSEEQPSLFDNNVRIRAA